MSSLISRRGVSTADRGAKSPSRRGGPTGAGATRIGLPRLRRSGRGDQIVRVLVWTPTSLGKEEKELLERLREVETPPPEADTGEPGFWERVKRAFTA